MRFVTYAGKDGEWVGVLSGEQIYPLQPGIRLIDLIGDDNQLRAAGEEALRRPRAVLAADAVRLRAPIPDPPTVRDFMTFEPVKGKDSATTLGPILVTPDELAPHRAGNAFALRMEAAINGIPIGADMWSNMSFSYAQMIAYASRGTEVRTGDILGSGTCGGGCLAELWGRRGLDAHAPLTPGDVVTISVANLGRQRSRVIADDQPGSGADQLRAAPSRRRSPA
jgi:Fumarylacetoacetate (FAA) hydrolase family